MEVHQERPPAYHTNPDTLVLPSVPQHDPASRPATSKVSLPDIRSLGLPHALPSQSGGNGVATQWMPIQPASLPSVPIAVPRQSIENIGSPMETESVLSPDGHDEQRAPSVISVDDPETRMAAEALSGLRNLDFLQSPPTTSATLPQARASQWQHPMSPPPEEDEEEPLLRLLTTSHPWIGNTINGSLSAYNTTKNYSPSFVRSSADFLERNIGSPMASTFGTVSRRTGVESGLRRYLGERRPSDLENPDSKRRRVKEDSPEHASPDVEKGRVSPSIYRYRSRAGSQASFATLESLPAYDENRSPGYEEHAPPVSSPPPQLAMQQRHTGTQRRTSHNWRTQLMITTSGLGAALHTNSLQSLKYCLRLLRNATDHVAAVMDALKTLLNKYTATQEHNGEATGSAQPYSLNEDQQAASRAISESIRALGEDIMNTMRSVVEAISRYAGGALPENASALVRRQLMSVPQRWRVASETGDANTAQTQDEAVRQGHRLVAFANQSLDMFAQVSLVLSSTIDSAEAWLETMGRKRHERSQTQQSTATQLQNGEKSSAFAPVNDATMVEKR